MKLAIAVRGFDVLEAYKPELMCLRELNVQLHIYNTMKAPPSNACDTSIVPRSEEGKEETNSEKNEALENTSTVERSLNTSSSLSEASSQDLDFADFHQGRPEIAQILRESVELSGSLAVVCCGPPVFVDQVRDQTANLVLTTPSKTIEYFEEFQNW